MPRNNCLSTWFAAAVVFGLMVIPAVGHAQTCATNADCGAGLTCQASVLPPQPTGDPTCLKGQTCAGAATDAGVSTATPVQTISTCQVAPCKMDSDCATGMLCHTEKSTSCSGGGATCPPNTVCDVATVPSAPDSCVETTVSTCAFKWQLPCSTDQDCGGDFVCTPAVTGSCSVGVGVATSGGTSSGGSGTATPVAIAPVTGAPAAVPPDADGGTRMSSDGGTTCTTVTSFPGYCQPKAIVCAVDADCPTPWTCVAPPMPLSGGAPRAAGDSSTGVAAPAADGAVPVSPKLCQPPFQYPVRGAGGPGIAIDVGTQPTTGSGSDGGGQAPPVGPKGGGESAASGSGGAGCAVAGGGDGSGTVPLLGSLLLGLLVSSRLVSRRPMQRRRTARLDH